MVDDLDKNRCNGCSGCHNICPLDAIDMTADNEGFKYPIINYNKCINCGKCDAVCPMKYEIERDNSNDPKVFAAWSLNEEFRINSTSGGIFSELAMQVLNNLGYVCGAVYAGDNMVEHFITCSIDDVARLRQSKYVQSDINYIYRKIGNLLSGNKIVLFCGTPCEGGGLLNFLKCAGIGKSKLILVDFVCRGSNSPKVYQLFLEDLEKRYGSGIRKVWFKNKTYGWNRFSTKIEFEDGLIYFKDRFSDSYIRGYIEANLYIRPSCGQCAFKGFPRVSDITLGDFWGISLEDKSKDTDKGTSLVIINSTIGDVIFNDIREKIFFEKKQIEDAIPCNSCMNESIVHGIHRDTFMKDLDELNIVENINRFL